MITMGLLSKQTVLLSAPIADMLCDVFRKEISLISLNIDLFRSFTVNELALQYASQTM